MTMRTEAEIREDIATCKQAYFNKPTYELAMHGKALNAELIDCLREGAGKCPTCGDSPHAMLKRAESYGGDGSLVSGTVYEVGCLAGHPATTAGKAHRAQGPTAAKAVENWNAGKWLKWTPPGSVTVTVTRKDGSQDSKVLEMKR